MSSNLMPESEALKLHFSNLTETKDFTFFSGFTAALRDARKFTKRNQDNGTKLTGDAFGDHGSWLGTIGYLSLLDQVGKCFKPLNSNLLTLNAITKALKYFTALTDKEIDAIYALRCGFAHDFSLFNLNPNNPSLTHYFLVNQGIQTPVVTLPQILWDGNHSNKTPQNVTIINLEALGDLVENIVKKLKQMTNDNELEVTLQDGSDELIHRYSFYTIHK
jgi:hypothetical protein